jgi:hypothetical protein
MAVLKELTGVSLFLGLVIAAIVSRDRYMSCIVLCSRDFFLV